MNTKNLMNISEVSTQLPKIKLYMEEEIAQLEKIKATTESILQWYQSSEQNNLNNSNKITREAINKILKKREEYINIIEASIASYEVSSIQTSNIFHKISEDKNNG